jgi:hypothetical protein
MARIDHVPPSVTLRLRKHWLPVLYSLHRLHRGYDPRHLLLLSGDEESSARGDGQALRR